MRNYIFNVETSHMVDVPKRVEARSLQHMREQLQSVADSKKLRIDRPPIGPLSYRYELDDDDEPLVVHAFFVNSRGKRLRFMRLKVEERY